MHLMYEPEILLLHIFPRKTKTYAHTKNCTQMCIFICSNHNHLKLETTQMSFNKWMDKQSMAYPYNLILLSNEKERTITISNNHHN